MTKNEIKDIIIEKIHETNSIVDDNLNVNETLNQIGLDSLDHLELIMKLEQEFNIGISEEDLINMENQTVETLTNYVSNRLKI
jgi:acyl carrier protein